MSKNLQLANKEPLFHMVKRDTISIKKAWGIRIIALFFALIACALFIVPITHLNPIEIYKTIIDPKRLQVFLKNLRYQIGFY